jgi:hypothetical protein
MRSLWAPLLIAIALSACSSRSSERNLVDGGLFEVPDSGFTFDARPRFDGSVEEVDSGPFICDAGCPDGSFCGCVTSPNRSCGCLPRGGYSGSCDPQVEDSCKWPYECTRAQTIQGIRYLCSDGREGTPCSRTDQSCNTSNGCVCFSTPIGFGCACQGNPGPNPLYCDPQVPASCPEGTCVRLDGQNAPIYICSSGEANEPCNPGDNTCHTSLGCTCPLIASRESCRCSEPGTLEGDPCDPEVAGSCASPLECVVLRTEAINQFVTECVGGTPRSDGGTDPLACDPGRPLCPNGYSCEEVRPNVFRCTPGM